MIKKLDKISYLIAMGGCVNFAICMIFATILKIVVEVAGLNPDLMMIGYSLVIYSIPVSIASIMASTKINELIKERRESREESKTLEKAS